MNEDKLKELNNLFKETLDKFNAIKDTVALKDSFPIMWFGDLEAYDSSNSKIVTIGLNPSDREFEEKEHRFGDAGKAIERTDFSAYYDALNHYFHNNPYRKWFVYYNKVLSCFDASYRIGFDKKVNTAVHIDFVPVATITKWSASKNGQTDLLDKFGDHLLKVIKILEPDIIIVSVNETIMKKDFLKHDPTDIAEWCEEFINEKGYSYKDYVKIYKMDDKYEVSNIGKCLLIWGKCYHYPFNPMTNHKYKALEKIYQEYINPKQ